MKAAAYWCLITIRWAVDGDAGFITFEGEMFVRKRGTTVREVYQGLRRKALDAAPDGAECAVVCWVMEPLRVRRRRWWQRGDRVPPDLETLC